MKDIKETVMKYVFLLCACASILAVVLICLFLFANGIPAIGKIGIFDFLLGEKWKPGNDIYGILPFILGSIYVTAGAILIGVPVGILTAVYMAKFCPPKLYRFMKPAVDLLAGIPSVVYGFFGLVVLVPFVREFFGRTLGFGGNGASMFTASVMLGIMILPTIISVGESSIRAVPYSYHEGALALGATHQRSVFFTATRRQPNPVLWQGLFWAWEEPLVKPWAVIMIAGTKPRMPKGIFKGVRTLTSNIVIEMGICYRFTQRCPDCNGSCFIRIYSADQSVIFVSKEERKPCMRELGQ